MRFGLDGTEYEIDLNKKNAAALRKKVAPYVEHARKAGRGPLPEDHDRLAEPSPAGNLAGAETV